MADTIDRTENDVRLIDHVLQDLQRLLLAAIVMEQTRLVRFGVLPQEGHELAPPTDVEQAASFKAVPSS